MTDDRTVQHYRDMADHARAQAQRKAANQLLLEVIIQEAGDNHLIGPAWTEKTLAHLRAEGVIVETTEIVETESEVAA